MPAEYEVIPRHRLVVTRYSGLIDDDCYVGMVRRMIADERYRPGFDELVLFADDVRPEVSEATLREVIGAFARYHGPADHSIRTAVVLGRLELELLFEFYRAISAEDPAHVQVLEMFRDVDDALTWLGIPPKEIDLPDRGDYSFDRDLADRAVVERLRRQLVASTERERRVTNRLSGVATRYRRLVENLGERFVAFSLELGTGDLLYVSPGFETVFGSPPDQALYRHHADVIAWCHDDGAGPDLVTEAIEGGSPVTKDYRFRHPDGTIRTVEVTHRITRNGRGEPVVEGIAEDVTRARAREAELRAEKDKFHIVADFTTDWEYWVAPDGSLRYCSPACTSMTGFGAEAFVTDPSLRRRLVHPDDLPVFDRLESHRAITDGAAAGEYRLVDRSGDVHWIEDRRQPVRGADGEFHGVRVSGRDVTSRKAAEKRVEFLATHDALTGLPNRSLLKARLELALAQADRLDQRLGVLFLDVDDFKLINDVRGHAAGDAVLQELARRIDGSTRDSDTAARVGGDEFIVVVAGQRDRATIRRTVDKIHGVLARPYSVDGSAMRVGVSIGAAVFPDDGCDGEGLMRAADDALYRVKRSGKAGVEFACHPTPDRRSPV